LKAFLAIFLLFLILPISSVFAEEDSVQAPPVPYSPVITGIAWEPASGIQRAALGSDNWPVTWGDDGQLYTAYGDGNGFDPPVPDKLSLGFARVEGAAESYAGFNIRSDGEQVGEGATGKKASGILMVEGVLYMWVRNANNNGEGCQLAWSTDHALTWTWSNWQFAEFGYCTFINFGQNYAGARDNYIYTVTHDHPSAYQASDRFILMRVPKGQITNRAAYEFFEGADLYDEPFWSADINERGAVFTHPGKARRSGISYNAALDRYLWWQGIPNKGDEKDSGGFGIYDAPEPWGPWTTVYYTEQWDVGPGETASFPTKWMSPDGLTLYLVFSGDDSFSVRKATLNTGGTLPDLGPGTIFLPVALRSSVVEVDENDWSTAPPSQVGMDESLLAEARDYALSGGGAGYIIRQGKLVMSWGSAGQRYDVKSATKSIGVTALGLAIQDGLLALGDPAQDCFPGFGTPPDSNLDTGWLDDITILNLATHTAGFDKPGGYPALQFAPGTTWAYSDGGANWLADCLTVAFEQDLNDLLFERVFSQLGISGSDLDWRSNLYREDTISGIKRREFGAGISANVDALARIGYLYLNNGNWEGQQLIPQSFVDSATTAVPGVVGLPVDRAAEYPNASDHYGLLWWTNSDGSMTNVPQDAFWAWGLGDNLIVVIPSLDIVATRAGSSLGTNGAAYDAIEQFIEPIAQSVLD
jgi:CubicO group peptidase (beta-lactamase class C family)